VVYAMKTAPLTWLRSISVVAALALPCCKGTPVASSAPEPFDVDLVGCSAVRRAKVGPICDLPESRTVRMVLPPGARDARTSIDSSATAIDAGVVERQQDGPILSITVPPGATMLTVDATVGEKRKRAQFRLATPEKSAWLDEARAARGKGDLDRASSLASEHLHDSVPALRAAAHGLLARIALSRGRADEAFPLFRQAIELHRSADRVSDVVDDSFALAFALHQRSQRYTEARAVLDGITSELGVYAEGRARAPYYRASLAAETADRRTALTLFREAERAAHRLGMTRLERNARGALALELQEVGRARASLPLLAALEKELDDAGSPEKPTPCERVETANNRGWGALLAMESGDSSADEARAALERALGIEGCADSYVRGFALSNLARLAVDQGDLTTAERRLGEARSGVKEPRGTERVSWLELEGRILLGRGRAGDALRLFDEALAIARASMMRPQEWSLLVVRADALLASKRNADAIVSLRSAEDVLDDALVLVPLGEGRGAFVGGRSRSARALLGLLVNDGKALDAAAVAERAFARVLASALGALRLERLSSEDRAHWEESVRTFRTARAAIDADAANDWKLPADTLRNAANARAERERELRGALERALGLIGRPRESRPTRSSPANVLEIDIHPDTTGFFAIAKRGAFVTAHRVPDPRGRGAEELARGLLDPVEKEIERVEGVVVRAYGAWRDVDVQALPLRGEPLIAQVPVVYSIGAGAPPAAAARASGKSLVIGDPTGDLPAAFEEAHAVARLLEAADGGAGTVRLLVRDRATSGGVSAELEGAARLHYAGHGVFAGEEGWESALPLTAGGRLTAPDILALAPAPHSVVLTGCEAAKSTGEAEGLGLAQAFIVAGSAEVLAPVRRVPDALAGKLAAALYRARSDAPLHLRAREALLAVRREEPGSDWAAFRVLVP
jgi:tetratricopeptide (TPR) repeat protein